MVDSIVTAEEPSEDSMKAVSSQDTDPLSGEPSVRASSPLLGSVAEELATRYKHCSADYTTVFTWFSKSLSAALFMFFATLFSTVALGAHIQIATDNRIGLSEYLVMNSIAGVAHSLVGTQPLLIIRPTGPITAILTKLCTLADSLKVDLFQLLAATGICVSILMFAIAFSGFARHIQRLTPFVHEIFACFVCSIYLHDGISDVHARFVHDSLASFGVSLFDLNLALIVFGLSIKLQGAREWRFFPASVRILVSDYAVTIAVVTATLISYSVDSFASAEVLRIRLPDAFAPSLSVSDISRPWYAASLSTAAPSTWLTAAAAAVPISFFFYMDQGISSLLCQLPGLGLTRGAYYHSSFAALGVLNFIGPLFGCPFVTGSLPHSPQFVRALSTKRPDGSIHVAESRVTPFIVYLMIGMPLLAPRLIKAIPEAAIDGVLMFVGYEGIVCTGLWDRVLLSMTPKYDDHFPPAMRAIRATRVRQYTAIQLALFALCWLVNLSPFGLGVAFIIVGLVPLRERILPRIFTTAELRVLDAPRA